MKKTLLLLFAFMASLTGAWAQTDLTVGKTVQPLGGVIQVSSYTDEGKTITGVSQENLQNMLVEGNSLAILLPQPTENWSSTAKASEQPVQGFFIDLGEAKTIGSVKFVWETADVAALNYQVYLSNTEPSNTGTGVNVVVDGSWNKIVDVANNAQAAANHILASAQTGRYVIVQAQGARNVYGIKLKRFQVFDNEVASLYRLDLSAPKTYLKKGISYNLTLNGFDKTDAPFDISGETPVYAVSPVAAGSVTDGAFTASQLGTIGISATIDEVTSNTVTVYSVPCDNLITSTTQFIDLTDGISAADAGVLNGDEKAGNLWAIIPENGSQPAEGTAIDKSFTIDLGSLYNIYMVAIAFEGASASKYTLSFSADNTNWTTEQEFSYARGINAHKDRITDFTYDHSKVRYIKVHLTEVSTGYGLKIYEISVFGTAVSITPAYNKTTYVTTAALDFTAVDGLDAYVATSANASSVTMTKVEAPVPAGTPLMLIGTKNTEYNVPVVASASAPAGNLLRAGDGTTVIGGTSKYDYILYTDGLFYRANEGALAAGKAYLHLDEAPAGARSLNIVFDDEEVTSISEELRVKNEKSVPAAGYFDLQGRKVAQLYIVNGKKVVIK